MPLSARDPPHRSPTVLGSGKPLRPSDLDGSGWDEQIRTRPSGCPWFGQTGPFRGGERPRWSEKGRLVGDQLTETNVIKTVWLGHSFAERIFERPLSFASRNYIESGHKKIRAPGILFSWDVMHSANTPGLFQCHRRGSVVPPT